MPHFRPHANRLLAGLTATSITLTGCTAFRSGIIQAPTPEEQSLSRQFVERNPSTTLPIKCDVDDPKIIITPETRSRICKSKNLKLHSDYRSSEQFCRNIVTWGQGSYKSNLAWGISSGAIGLAGATTAVTAIATADTKKHVRENIALAAGGAVLTAIGFIFLGRASAAATAGGEAGLAFIPGLSDEDRWKTCLAARAKWLGANAEATRVAFPKAPAAASSESEEK